MAIIKYFNSKNGKLVCTEKYTLEDYADTIGSGLRDAVGYDSNVEIRIHKADMEFIEDRRWEPGTYHIRLVDTIRIYAESSKFSRDENGVGVYYVVSSRISEDVVFKIYQVDKVLHIDLVDFEQFVRTLSPREIYLNELCGDPGSVRTSDYYYNKVKKSKVDKKASKYLDNLDAMSDEALKDLQ